MSFSSDLIIVFIGFVVVFLGLDIYGWIRYGNQETFSYRMATGSRKDPMLAAAVGLAFGFLLGHWFFGVCVPGEVSIIHRLMASFIA